ncbi:MAG: hypothetical protein ACI9Y8_001480 [Candidatus Omnitrophota bacterium]|jgi:hypothetical protein
MSTQDSSIKTTSNKKHYLPWLALGLILIANAIFLHTNCFKVFKFFDMGAFIDGSWRIFCGQKPYTDFILQMGPIHFYLNSFFFHIFGFGKIALWAHVVFVHSLVIVATYLLMSRYVSSILALLVSLITLSCYYWWLSHPFYTLTAHLWPFIAVVILIRHLPFKNPKSALYIAFICGCLATLSFFTKPNVGAGHGLMFLLTFGISRFRKQALTGLVLGAFTCTAFMLFVVIGDVSAFIDQTILAFGKSHGSRLLLIFTPKAWSLNYYWIIILITMTSVLIHKKALRELMTLFGGLYITMILETNTSGAVWEANVPLMGLFMGIAILLIHSPNLETTRPRMSKISKVCLISLICLSLFLIQTYTRYGVEVKGWMVPDRWQMNGMPVSPKGNYALKSKPLDGWMVEKEQGQEVDALVEFIKRFVPKQESLMVITDLTILYALTGRESYRGIPYAFTLDVSPAPGKHLEQFRKNFTDNPPMWIVTHRGRVAFLNGLLPYLGIQNTIVKDYGIAFKAGRYIILRRKVQKKLQQN